MAKIDTKKYTLAVSIIAIFICVSIIVWAIRKYGKAKPKTIQYPPYVSPCPDFWESVGVNPDGSHKCRPSNKDSAKNIGPTAQSAKNNMNGLPTCNTTNYSSNSAYNLALTGHLEYDVLDQPKVNFVGLSDSTKCKWADKCGVYWEGISGKPCEELTGGNSAA